MIRVWDEIKDEMLYQEGLELFAIKGNSYWKVKVGYDNVELIETNQNAAKIMFNTFRADFYGKNSDHKSYTLKMCKNAMEWIKRKCPIPIYNCSNYELLEKRTLEEVIQEINPSKLNRDYFLNIL